MAKVELKEFIEQVRDEVLRAYETRSSDPVFNLAEVDLEVSFTLSGKGVTKGKLLVVELEGELSSERVHKVVLRLKPIPRDPLSELTGKLKRITEDSGDPVFPVGEIPNKDFRDMFGIE